MSTDVGQLLTQAAASRALGRPARFLADLIYTGAIDPSSWPVIAGKRLVPAEVVEQLRRDLGGAPLRKPS
jgi:hypothetical protein